MALFNRILVAVRDTDPRRKAPLAKVIALAKASNATVELFHAVSTPLFLPEAGTEVSIAHLKRDTVELHQTRLEKIAAAVRRHGVTVQCTVTWDHPPHEAIVRHARETGADLIVAECHGTGGRKWLMRSTDWELIKSSEFPVLLLRDPRPYRRPGILAAIDPTHAHAKPEDLDGNILVAARALAALLRGRLDAVHANHPPLYGLAADSPLTLEDLRTHGRREFEKFLAHAELPARRGHLVDGDPAQVIPRVAKNLKSGIVVMGAVSRSGLQRLFIGNTAERVLDKLACDVLVVKPGDFRARVASTHREALVLTPAPATVLPA